MENMKKERKITQTIQLVNGRTKKKSDCMAQKNEKTCEWVNGEKKEKKRTSERASEVANRQTNEG